MSQTKKYIKRSSLDRRIGIVPNGWGLYFFIFITGGCQHG